MLKQTNKQTRVRRSISTATTYTDKLSRRDVETNLQLIRSVSGTGNIYPKGMLKQRDVETMSREPWSASWVLKITYPEGMLKEKGLVSDAYTECLSRRDIETRNPSYLGVLVHWMFIPEGCWNKQLQPGFALRIPCTKCLSRRDIEKVRMKRRFCSTSKYYPIGIRDIETNKQRDIETTQINYLEGMLKTWVY